MRSREVAAKHELDPENRILHSRPQSRCLGPSSADKSIGCCFDALLVCNSGFEQKNPRQPKPSARINRFHSGITPGPGRYKLTVQHSHQGTRDRRIQRTPHEHAHGGPCRRIQNNHVVTCCVDRKDWVERNYVDSQHRESMVFSC